MPDCSLNIQTLSVIGLGYIGLPTAAIFARAGLNVVGVDVNPQIVETVNRGEIHIHEPDLDQAVREVVKQGKLRATLTPQAADAFLIAVPTPFKGTDHAPDLSCIQAAAYAIAPVLKKEDLVVLESTCPIGATEQMAQWLAEKRPDLSFPQQAGEESDIRIAHCPERVLPGRVMQELLQNDRVIGGMTPQCAQRAHALYRHFVTGYCHITDLRTAELCKLAENAFRDVNIAYANELSMICDQQNIDVREVIHLANKHPRVNILQPGAGVGGHCIAVDPWFIISGAPETARLMRTAREVNDAKPAWVLDQIRHAAAQFEASAQRKPIIASLGLSFKPDIDDLRESPALRIATELYQEYAEELRLVEPYLEAASPALANCPLISLKQALEQADMLVVLVAHRAFHALATHPLRPDQKIMDFAGLCAASGQIELATVAA